jgi:DNA repair protein RadC
LFKKYLLLQQKYTCVDNYTKLSIKDWAEEDRPREKLLAKGERALSDAELLAILIGSGSRTQSAVELSRDILKQLANNDLNELGKKSINQLMDFKGIGEAKAITIVAALELGRRRRAAEATIRTQISSSRDVFEMMQPVLGDLPHEEFWIVLLNRANKVIGKEAISKGGVTATVVEIKPVLKRMIETYASGVILCHNHPSGSLQPSSADIQLTKRLSDAAKIIETNVLDHLIVTDTSYYSFADEGMM